MGMFTSYQQELVKAYQPNNLVNAFPTTPVDSNLNPSSASKPYEEFDAKGQHVGYSWKYGETLNLEFSLEGEVTIEPDAFVSSTSGVTPHGLVAGRAGQKYYNLADFRSWHCYIDAGTTVWEEDLEFMYPENGTSLRPMYMPVDKYMTDKHVIVTLFNFRMEPVHTWSPEVRNSKVTCFIDSELSQKLTKGIYHCSVVVENQLVRFTIFNTTDCVLLVK